MGSYGVIQGNEPTTNNATTTETEAHIRRSGQSFSAMAAAAGEPIATPDNASSANDAAVISFTNQASRPHLGRFAAI